MKRRRLPDERKSITHKVEISSAEFGNVSCYITVGLYDDGEPGELFIRMEKEGSTIGTLMDQWAVAVSIALQSGVPLETITSKFSYCNFEPSGMTSNQSIPFAKSPIDYVARWLAKRFETEESNEREEEKARAIDGLGGQGIQ